MDTRFGGDPAARERLLAELLYPVRDTVLDKAGLQPGDTVLDVGTGDGLIAFGALEWLGPSGHVVFSDISQDLLDHCRAAAAAEGLLDRCRFVLASADSLDGIADASVDVVTTRSVLIYVQDKAEALRAFYRVLRPGGRISVFEPIDVLMRDPAGSSATTSPRSSRWLPRSRRSISPSSRPAPIPWLISTSVTWYGTPSGPGSPTSASNCA